MIKIWKKYSFLIILMVIAIFVHFYFYPAQEEKYTRTEIKNLEENRFYIIIIIEVLLLILIFLSNILHSIVEKKIKEIAYMIFYISFLTFIFYSFAKPAIIGLELFLNRQKNVKEITENYVMMVKSENNGLYYINWMMQPESEEIIDNDIEIDYADYQKLQMRDTIELHFKIGWLGIKHSPQLNTKNIPIE